MPSLLSLLCSMNIAKSIVFPAVFSCHSHCSPWLLFSGTFVSSAWMKFGEECARERERELLMGTRSDGFFLFAHWIHDSDCRRRSFSIVIFPVNVCLEKRSSRTCFVRSVSLFCFEGQRCRYVPVTFFLHFSNRTLERKWADETVGHCFFSAI